MMCNQSSDKVEWGHMKMPEIIIDSDNETVQKSLDKEPYNSQLLETHRVGTNHLSCKSNMDDVDSGIHESNDIFLPGFTSALHSNRLSLRDMKKRTNLSEVRSYSTNCIPIDCSTTKDGLGLVDSRLCRNCSTKTYSKRPFETSKRDLLSNQYIIKEAHNHPDPKRKTNSKDSLQHRLCRIRVLLVCMKILLGSTMTGLGLFLLSISESIKIKDCAFWASGPLFISGLYEVFVFKWRKKLKKRIKICYIITIICGVLSFICSILCLLSSIFSGIHGNWISEHGNNCYPDDGDVDRGTPGGCCYNLKLYKPNIKLNFTINCICQDVQSYNLSQTYQTMIYHNLSCRYVFSAVKDYLILQCALMAIGSGVCLWLLQMTIQRVVHDWSISRQMILSPADNEEQNCVGQSPVIPMKIRCFRSNDQSLLVNELIQKNSSQLPSFNQQLMSKA